MAQDKYKMDPTWIKEGAVVINVAVLSDVSRRFGLFNLSVPKPVLLRYRLLWQYRNDPGVHQPAIHVGVQSSQRNHGWSIQNRVGETFVCGWGFRQRSVCKHFSDLMGASTVVEAALKLQVLSSHSAGLRVQVCQQIRL